MYKLRKVSTTAAIYAHDMASKLLPLINAYIGGKVLSLPVKNRGVANIALGNDSPTRRFLLKMTNQSFLEKFLLWTPKKQIKFVNSLYNIEHYPVELIFNKLGSGIYDKYYRTAGGPVDHFNEIIFDIFVRSIYDGDNSNPPLFDKRQFIRDSGIWVCPYCGAEKIKPTSKTKRQIDHFIPKRKYPMFALSYYNLIPSCDECNESPNKGQKDPIDELHNNRRIDNPYTVNNEDLRFNLDLLGTDIFQDDNFKLITGFSKEDYLLGYDYFFDLSDRYYILNNEAANVYRKMVGFKAQNYYRGMEIDPEWLKSDFNTLFGYSPANSIPSKQRLFKMNADLFFQYYKLRQGKQFYTKRMKGSGTKTECMY